MTFSSLTSSQVLEFFSLNTWTKVILLSKNNGVYIVTTEDRKTKQLEDMKFISLHYSIFNKVIEFKLSNIVAVEIEGKWFRGKLISYNEFLPNNTTIELIDFCTIYETKLENLIVLPTYLNYEPLALPIKFKNFIPKTTTFSIKPLLSESVLHEGVVLVDVDYNMLDNVENGIQKLDSKFNCISSNSKINENMTNGHDDSFLRLNSTENCNINNVQSMTISNGLFSYKKSDGALQCQIKPKQMPLENKDYCIITYFEDFSCIYVCKVIYDDINDTYDLCDGDVLLETAKSTDKIQKNHPVLGDVVKVYSTIHTALFRAKVLRNNKDGSYKVFYIDYGNMETVSSDDIYELADELKKPGLAVLVGISDLKHIQVNEQIKNFFNNIAEEEKIFMIEFDERSSNCLENVKLKDVKSGSYINNTYITNYMPINSEHLVDILTNGTNITSANENKLNNLKNKIVYLKHYEDMDNVFILENVMLFNEVMLNLLQEKSSNNKTCFNVGDIVKIVSNGSSYRAEIQKIDGDLINVKNIDFGYSETVHSDVIYELSNDLLKIPGLAIKISVKSPFIEDSEAFLQYTNNIEKTPLYVDFDICNSNKFQKAILRRKDNSKDIFEEFIRVNQHNHTEISNNIKINEVQKKEENVSNNFQSIILENGDYCIVSYFKDFKNIYLCKAIKNMENIYEMHNMDIIMQTSQSIDKKKKTNLVIGDIVKVLSPLFNALFRGKIMKIENDDFHIFYIDYGNTEIVCSSNIFELSDELRKETKLPIRGSIEVPINAIETEEIVNLFLNLSENNVVLTIEYEMKTINGLENILLKELDSGNSVNDEVLSLLPTKQFSIDNSAKYVLSHFENLNSIYVLKVSDLNNISLISDEMNSAESKLKANPLVSSTDIVKVKSPLYKEYYRAKIIGAENNDNFQVFYIDFGKKEVVQSSNIFELPDNLSKKPGMVNRIGIHLPSNVEGNEEIENMFTNLINDFEEILIEFDETCGTDLEHCTLKIISSGLVINNEVVRLFNESSVLGEKLDNIDLTIEEPTKTLGIINQNKSELLKNGEEVNLRYFLSSDSVYVSQVSQKFDDLMYTMNYAPDKCKVKENIEIGDLVKVMFDELLCRAKVLKKVDKGHLISFIDFGNEEIVNDNAIFELSEELQKIPGLSIKIGIKGSPKIEKTNLVTEYFDKLINECTSLYIEYDEYTSNGLSEVSLKTKDNCDVFDELLKIIGKPLNVKEEIITKPHITENLILKAPELNTEFKSGDIVFCCNFEDFNHIYLCKNSYNNVPENIILNNCLKEHDVVKTNPKCGDIVRVNFEGKIFRGIVHGKCNETYKVFLMDIGKNEDIVADNIFELSNDLKNIPGLAKKFGLKTTKNIQITNIVKEYFNKLWCDDPVPLILTYDEDNFNYSNEITLQKKSGHNIIDDLLLNINSKFNGVNNNTKSVAQNAKVNNNGYQNFQKGDHVEYLCGNNVDCIFIRNIKLYKEFKPKIEQLKIEKSDNMQLLSPKLHDIVAVYSSKQKGFYRAKIFPVPQETDKFGCVFIDFGYFEKLAPKNIFMLPNYISTNNVPILGVKVSLAGLTKISNNKITSYLSSFIGKTFILDFHDNNQFWYKQVVLKELYSCNSMNDKIQQLISNNFLSMLPQGKLEKNIIMPEIKKSEVEKPSHPIKSGSIVYITHFENFDSIYVRNASYHFIEEFNAFNKRMFKHLKSGNNCHARMVNIGDKVCVRSSLDIFSYSRAIVIGKNGDEFSVFHLDYGMNELINIEDIFELPKEFEKAQNFVFKVQLQDMLPLNAKNKDAVNNYLQKKIFHKTSLIIEFNEFNSKGLDDVILKTEISKKNIVDEINELIIDPPLNLTLTFKKTGQVNADNQISSKNNMSPLPARRILNRNLNK